MRVCARTMKLGAAAIACSGFLACGDSAKGPTAEADEIPLIELGDPQVPAWKALYWVNSNSGAEFAWVLGSFQADKYVAAVMNGTPEGAGGTSPICLPFGGTVDPGTAAQSMQDVIPPDASFEIWMRPRDKEFDGTSGPLATVIEEKLAWFQSCVDQSWPTAPVVAGFMCVHEQKLGGGVDCDSLADAFASGVMTPSGRPALYGIVGSPQNMARTDVDVVLGEMYEPIYFPPSDTCPDPADGTTYGGEIAAYINTQSYGAAAAPAFGGPSATCPLDHAGFEAAASALGGAVTAPLAGLGVWS